jgi:hypothetical protein
MLIGNAKGLINTPGKSPNAYCRRAVFICSDDAPAHFGWEDESCGHVLISAAAEPLRQ